MPMAPPVLRPVSCPASLLAADVEVVDEAEVDELVVGVTEVDSDDVDEGEDVALDDTDDVV